MRIRTLLTAALLAALPLSGALAKDAALAKAVANEHRSPTLVERDKSRHPQEVLEFAGIKPTMTVVEVSPGGGYWTEILGPYLKDKGTYYTALSARAMENWNKKLADNKANWGDVKVTEFGKDKYDIAPAGSADLVITSRNVHNWMGQGFSEEAFGAFYKALKPGGVLSVEEHRAPADQPQDPKAANGYVREDHTIALAEKAGFKLVSRSEALANPKDTKDWPKGVWTLPPTLQLGEQDRAKYQAIGEADNFLLKFQKPK
jgi:predicted methyltransferase